MFQIIGAALLVAIVGMACPGARAAPVSSGITDDQILFGQSAVFSGPSQGLGREMCLGISAAFYEANRSGGVHGREVALKDMDDSYETDYAFHTTKWLIEKAQVFAPIGTVGTPTSRVSSPLAYDAGVIDPNNGNFYLGNLRMVGNVWSTLLRVNPQDRVTIEGDLAESWTASPDGTECSFKIRQGVVDHEGNPYTVDDAQYQMFRFVERPNGVPTQKLTCIRNFVKPIEEGVFPTCVGNGLR